MAEALLAEAVLAEALLAEALLAEAVMSRPFRFDQKESTDLPLAIHSPA
jgi:hypothetical protein